LAHRYGKIRGKTGEGSGGRRAFRPGTGDIGGLSRGLTGKEPAGDLSLSVNTVKSVIRSIYNKPEAVNRADAVRIAMKPGIITENSLHKKTGEAVPKPRSAEFL
jgi:hypothetical protein